MARKRSRDINIPLDLTVEILKKLPAKSLARFRCVSNEWENMINKFIVIDSIVTRCLSLTKPTRDIHVISYRGSSTLRFSNYSYSFLSPQITNEEQLYNEYIFENSKGYDSYRSFQYVRGLIGFQCLDSGLFKIHNPTTRQSVTLPVTSFPPSWSYFFGYDPIKNQYKVVSISRYQPEQSCLVFTLGDPTKQWRDIHCCIGRHPPFGEAVCINGTIYYKAKTVLASFNVRSEKFNLIQDLPIDPEDLTLINYQEKLGCMCCSDLNKNDVDMLVMENAEKQEWTKITFVAMLQDLPSRVDFAGVTHPGGEIVLVHKTYYSGLASVVYYYDPKRNSRRRAEIQTTTSLFTRNPSVYVRIRAVTDHVENIMRL
ncbi:unnamed protein product [Microthlaspi erraticum]|uniref:F-box domain-containing protein n=2 Tax=Microthlaspi erraticum TaxID=1685480 RepID=A0A6D2JQH2_9BRAS|nr:unnamed protein product [Microthlaspi erraticum]CAA7043903.1 unnamed protein product [Microthlaspi erraticum]